MLLKRHFLTSVYYKEDVHFLKNKLKDIIKKCLDEIAEHLGEEGLEQVLISDWYVPLLTILYSSERSFYRESTMTCSGQFSSPSDSLPLHVGAC